MKKQSCLLWAFLHLTLLCSVIGVADESVEVNARLEELRQTFLKEELTRGISVQNIPKSQSEIANEIRKSVMSFILQDPEVRLKKLNLDDILAIFLEKTKKAGSLDVINSIIDQSLGFQHQDYIDLGYPDKSKHMLAISRRILAQLKEILSKDFSPLKVSLKPITYFTYPDFLTLGLIEGDWIGFQPGADLKNKLKLLSTDETEQVGQIVRKHIIEGELFIEIAIAVHSENGVETESLFVPSDLIRGYAYNTSYSSEFRVVPIVKNSLRIGSKVSFLDRGIAREGLIVSIIEGNEPKFIIEMKSATHFSLLQGKEPPKATKTNGIPLSDITKIIRFEDIERPVPYGGGGPGTSNEEFNQNLRKLALQKKMAGMPLFYGDRTLGVDTDGNLILTEPKSVVKTPTPELQAWYDAGCPLLEGEVPVLKSGTDIPVLLRPDLLDKSADKHKGGSCNRFFS